MMVASRLSSTIGSPLSQGERCLVIPLNECPDPEPSRERTRDACPYPDISRETIRRRRSGMRPTAMSWVLVAALAAVTPTPGGSTADRGGMAPFDGRVTDDTQGRGGPAVWRAPV